MKPIEFPEMTVTVAENQPPYLPLPAYCDEEHTVSRWALSWRERLTVLLTGRFWLMQKNFGAPLQPIKPMVESPWEAPRA